MTKKEQEILNYMQKLQISREEAEELWNCDNGLEENEEQDALQEKAKNVKISHEASAIDKTDRKARVAKVSNDKVAVFTDIKNYLSSIYGENVTVLTENKVIELKLNGKTFKIDLIEHRPTKK